MRQRPTEGQGHSVVCVWGVGNKLTLGSLIAMTVEFLTPKNPVPGTHRWILAGGWTEYLTVRTQKLPL